MIRSIASAEAEKTYFERDKPNYDADSEHDEGLYEPNNTPSWHMTPPVNIAKRRDDERMKMHLLVRSTRKSQKTHMRPSR
jgi:hypothetical protein